MTAFTMEIAGLAIGVQPLFESTREYCKPYLTDKRPEVFVDVRREALFYEQALLEREAVEEGLKIRKFPEPFLERAIIQRQVADHLVERNTLLLHGSAVCVDGRAYLFTAPCGTGKSTHTRLWRELLGQRAVMVNDDKPFLQVTDTGVLAYGSPWSGKHGLATNVCASLRGICSLHRGRENRIPPAEAKGLLDLLYRQAHTPQDAALAQKSRELVERICQRVPLWEMYCNKELDAAKEAYSVMCGEGSDLHK